jgi:general secretion pathway protein J
MGLDAESIIALRERFSPGSGQPQPRPPEILADDLRAAHFRYRALDADNKLGEWTDKWETGEALPLQVEITLRDADGRDWPPLLVALPLAGSFTGVGAGLQP